MELRAGHDSCFPVSFNIIQLRFAKLQLLIVHFRLIHVHETKMVKTEKHVDFQGVTNMLSPFVLL